MQKVGNMKPSVLTYIQTRSYINKSTSNKNKENTGRPRKYDSNNKIKLQKNIEFTIEI